jgi:hypothetical protein
MPVALKSEVLPIGTKIVLYTVVFYLIIVGIKEVYSKVAL